jgi:hypothetical protein
MQPRRRFCWSLPPARPTESQVEVVDLKPGFAPDKHGPVAHAFRRVLAACDGRRDMWRAVTQRGAAHEYDTRHAA